METPVSSDFEQHVHAVGTRFKTANDVTVLPRINGYRLLNQIGRGGQGQVFKAIRLDGNVKVAIKFILPGRLADDASQARFIDERRILEMLSHPSIVRVLDHGRLSSGELWFATKYVDGVPVSQYVHDLDRLALADPEESGRAKFPLARVLELFVSICRGVEAAHQAGVIHRDLKPANILVDDEGRPHILDFGLARSPFKASPEAVTLTGQFMGSPLWSSPEQLQGRPALIDTRTDVYSLGMMLYHALTGEFPFDSDQPLPQIIESISRKDPTPPRELRSFITVDLEAIVLTAIATQKRDRYPSVEAFRQDLESYLAGKPIKARPASYIDKLRKCIQRNRLLTAAILIGFILTTGYVVSVTFWYRRAALHAADAREKFHAARSALEFTISQVDSEFAKLPGSSASRKRLLEMVYALLEKLTLERNDDPALQDDMARTHAKLADIAQGLGRLDAAAKHVAAALEIREKQATDNPADAYSQAELSIALVRVGDIACGRGDRSKGHGLYGQALTIDEALVAAHPDSLHYLDNLSWSYDRMCWAAMVDGDDPEMVEHYEKRLDLALRLVASEPANRSYKRNLLCAYVLGSSVYGLPDEGLADNTLNERFEAAIRLASELLATEPDNLEYRRGMVLARRSLANLVADGGRLDEARLIAQTVLEDTRRVLAVEPENREWCWLDVVSTRELACLAGRARDFTAAESLYRKAIDRATTLSVRLPEDVQLRDTSAHAQEGLGILLYDLNRSKEARDLFRESIAIRKVIVSGPSAEPGHFLKLAQLLLTCPVEKFRDPAAALAAARRSDELSNGRSIDALRVLALAQQANGQIADARKSAGSALAIVRPGASRCRSDLERFLAQLPVH